MFYVLCSACDFAGAARRLPHPHTYIVGQKTKLLILSKHDNKTEKIGGM